MSFVSTMPSSLTSASASSVSHAAMTARISSTPTSPSMWSGALLHTVVYPSVGWLLFISTGEVVGVVFSPVVQSLCIRKPIGSTLFALTVPTVRVTKSV
jgi:hypothetical protein